VSSNKNEDNDKDKDYVLSFVGFNLSSDEVEDKEEDKDAAVDDNDDGSLFVGLLFGFFL
jgi:hypothetical protein